MSARPAHACALVVLAFAASAVADPNHKEVNYVPFTPSAKPVEKPPEHADSDHETTRLRPGFGYLGRAGAPLARSIDAVPVHLAGMRLWFRRRVGLDLALGANIDAGAGPRTVAVAARASLPVAILIEPHLTLFAGPSLGYAQGYDTTPGVEGLNPITGLDYTPPATQRRGVSISAGARFGGELQLGAIGLPRVALIAALGLDVTYTRGQTRKAPAPTTRDVDPSAVDDVSNRLALATSFLANLGVVFYF